VTGPTYVELIRSGDPHAQERHVAASVLAGLARWAAGQGGVASAGVARRRGVEAARDERGAIVVASGPALAFAAASPAGSPEALTWTTDVGAVRQVAEALRGDEALSAGAAEVLRSLPTPDEVQVDVASAVEAIGAAVDADRQQVAARLHDGPVQHLTAAQLLLDSAMWSGEDIPDAARAPIEQGLAALLQGIGGCREIMRELAEPTGTPEP
jgi:signal transduction histidine kinase